jgi:hypothetical protein
MTTQTETVKIPSLKDKIKSHHKRERNSIGTSVIGNTKRLELVSSNFMRKRLIKGKESFMRSQPLKESSLLARSSRRLKDTSVIVDGSLYANSSVLIPVPKRMKMRSKSTSRISKLH